MSSKAGAGGFGPNPWQQTSWDWRAAGNFMAGGAGSGLLICGLAAAYAGAASPLLSQLTLLLGLALVGLGLLCVWLEIGRPLRALHVFFNPRTSWMSREGFVALVLFPTGLLALLGVAGAQAPLLLLAAAFLYCQSRMLPAARGIPAWRPKLVIPLIFVTGLSEGCGLWLLLGAAVGQPQGLLALLLLALVLLRGALWLLYRRTVDASLAPRARAALTLSGRYLMWGGTLGAALLALASVAMGAGAASALLAALAGACAAAAGAHLKFTLVTRASFNQGFALTKLPVRGQRAPSASSLSR